MAYFAVTFSTERYSKILSLLQVCQRDERVKNRAWPQIKKGELKKKERKEALLAARVSVSWRSQSDKNRHRKSIDIMDINRFNPRINID